MTRWGVGPKFTILSISYSLVILFVSCYFYPFFRINFLSRSSLITIGIILILIGIPLCIISVFAINRAYNSGKLVTRGIYRCCRHPMYASWVVFIVPGMVLLANSWIGLTVPLVMYVLLCILVKKEEIYLGEQFGEEYVEYKKKVPSVLPIGWIKSLV